MILILVGIVAVVVLGIIAVSLDNVPRKPRRPRVKKQDIGALDLNKVRAQLKSRKGWEDGRIAAADAEYRKFLWLLYAYPGEMMVPWNQDMDEFWHQHILNTADYTATCMKLFGKYIDHTPEDVGNAAAQHQAAHQTSERYKREFDKGRTDSGTTQDSGCSTTVFAACSTFDPGHGDTDGHACSTGHSCSSGSSCGGGGCGGD